MEEEKTTEVRKTEKSVGQKTIRSFRKVGKGILVVGNTVYTRTFVVA